MFKLKWSKIYKENMSAISMWIESEIYYINQHTQVNLKWYNLIAHQSYIKWYNLTAHQSYIKWYNYSSCWYHFIFGSLCCGELIVWVIKFVYYLSEQIL